MQRAEHAHAHAVAGQQFPERRVDLVHLAQILSEVGDQVLFIIHAPVHAGPGHPWRQVADIPGVRCVLMAARHLFGEHRLRPPFAEFINDLERHFVEFKQDDLSLHDW